VKSLRVDTFGLRLADEITTTVAGRLTVTSMRAGGQSKAAGVNALIAATSAAGATLAARALMTASKLSESADDYHDQDARSAAAIYELAEVILPDTADTNG
jgi:hypothetical protein